jgi:hypothetical protein
MKVHISHVCKSWKEDGLFHLTTIEIAKAQKNDSSDLFKKDAKISELDQHFHLIGNIIIKDENHSS